MIASIYNGVSGITSMQTGLDIWGDNIANIDSTGYKGSTPEFATLFSTMIGNGNTTANDLGLGVTTQTASLNLTQGELVKSDSLYNMAIEGNGWFGVKLQDGSTAYTRNGTFNHDANGNIVDETGNFLLGTSANNIHGTTIAPVTSLTLAGPTKQTPLNLPTTLTYPVMPSTKITVKANLDPTTGNTQHLVGAMIDANGITQPVDMTFTKSATQPATGISWDVTAILGDTSAPIQTTTGQLTFDPIGGLLNASSLSLGGATIDFGSGFVGVTSVGGVNSTTTITHDGYPAGELLGYSINNDGDIVASFSNSRTSIVAKIPVYHFQNEQGLTRISGTMFSESANSGHAMFYTDSAGQTIPGAKIVSGELENSNVSMASAMTQLILIQKAYEANAKSITTGDQLLQKAIAMKK